MCHWFPVLGAWNHTHLVEIIDSMPCVTWNMYDENGMGALQVITSGQQSLVVVSKIIVTL